MARQEIDTTTDHGSYKGDPAKVAFEKINGMTSEIYTAISNPRELAYAETQVSASADTNGADVAGLSITFTVPAQPVYVTFCGSVRMSTEAGVGTLSLLVNGTAASQIVFGGDSFRSLCRVVRLAGLTPGTVANIKVRMASNTAGSTASLFGGAGDRPSLGASL